MSDIAIRVENIGKRYQLGQGQPDATLRGALSQSFTAALRRCSWSSRSSLSNPEPTSQNLAVGVERVNSSTAILQSQNGKSHRPDHIWALKDVSFEVKKGETIGIIGPNGSGKSTLLKLLAGITEPTEGEIHLNGRVTALIELGAGFHPELTGRENIYLNGAILGLSKKKVDTKFNAIVDFAELWDFIDTPVKHYSSGMYVRLGFAVAAHTDPEILLVDEVLAVGDALFQAKCFGTFREFKQQGKTVVLVTHNLDLVMNHCNPVLLLDKGLLLEKAGPKRIIDQYNTLLSSRDPTDSSDRGTSKSTSACSKLRSKELEWQGYFTINPHEYRYGSRKAEILEAGIFTTDNSAVQVLERNRQYIITVKVQHNESMPAAIVSFVVKDPKGTVLCGTNTAFQNIEIKSLEKGEVLLVSFKQTIRLNPGQYLLSIGAQAPEGSGYVAYDRRLDYLAFEVVGKEQRHGLFDPESTIDWRSIH